jgi:carbon storage regulator
MLVIARRKGQRIVVGHEVQIVVNDVSRGTVKLGIVAPPLCSILRGEVHEAIEHANREAAASTVEAAASAARRR